MLPQIFLDRMEQMLGSEYKAFLDTFEQERYQALRLNALKKGAHAGFAHLSKVPWAEDCFYYETSDQPGKHPYHEAGVYYIQEPSAMAPALLLDVRPGERILDLCAAPGGKSTQIAAKLNGEGFLLCNEIHPARAKILSENVERMGIINAYVTNETPAHLAEIFPEYFDKILVDAPCSGEGMFRKNEAACEEWSPDNVALCAKRQDEILDCAARMLKPGGRLVYSTCTFAPAENEGSVSRFLERWPGFSLIPIEKEMFGGKGCDGSADYLREDIRQCAVAHEPSKLTKRVSSGLRDDMQQTVDCSKGSPLQGENNMAHSALQTAEYLDGRECRLEYTLRLWPHRIKGEGHFAAVFRKSGELPEGYGNNSLNGFVTAVSDKELGEYRQFCQETFIKGELPFVQRQETVYIKFGDNIYLVSAQMPSVKGLKVLRTGLHIGTMKKNRFEPSHALALALSPGDVKYVRNLDSKENTVMAYLNGQTFPAEGEKGWYLICVDGFSIGWGKLAGGIMKNHYPRGLRINL